MQLRPLLAGCSGLLGFALLLAACAGQSSSDGGVEPSGGAGAVAGGAGAGTTAGASGMGTSTAGQGGSGAGQAGAGMGMAGTGGAPEPVFDASGLGVVGTAGPALCRLSADGRYLLVSVKNSATTEVGATEVRLATDDSAFQLRVRTPVLAGAATGEVKFDRGPVVGFINNWHFSVTIDPDGKHGGPQPTLKGECGDLRSRASAGMAPLATWYDTSTGLWNHTDWWTSANQLETVIDYSRETGDTAYFDEIDNTFVKNIVGDFDEYGYYDDDGWFAIAWIKAYELTHQKKYLDMAKTIFKRMTGGWDTKCGGGIYWASAKAGDDGLKNKNAIPNELFLSAAARLHRLTPGDTGAGSYLDWAQREWKWFKATGMINADKQIVDGLSSTDCKPGGPIFTYNQGALISGLVDLGLSTNDPTLLDEASAIAHANMNLSIGAAATGSAPCTAAADASNVTDGSSHWDSKWCSGGAGNQSLSLDLGTPRTVVGFRLRHAGAGGEKSAWNTREFEIETSEDGQMWTQVVKVTGNSADITTHPIPSVTARYARLHITAAQNATDFIAARIYEFEVYGIGL